MVEQETIKTLLVEDQEIVRLGLRAMLANIPELLVVAEARSGRSHNRSQDTFARPDINGYWLAGS